jgi:prepilin-type N-terminal cleavage/methylation domain-containing protein
MTFSLSRRKQGFTLIEILVVVAVMGLVVGIAIPAFMKSRTQARKQVCIENISQIESAKQQWGLEMQKKEGDIPGDGDLIGPMLFMKRKPECPGGGSYDYMPIGKTATCTEPEHVL